MEHENRLTCALAALVACVSFSAGTGCNYDDSAGTPAVVDNQCVDRITVWSRMMAVAADAGDIPAGCPPAEQLRYSERPSDFGLEGDVFFDTAPPLQTDAGDVCCYRTTYLVE
jgi:hypothetical protein